MSVRPSLRSTSAAQPAEHVLWHAMPVTRLLDCGMDYADVAALQRRSAEGMAWDVAAEQLAEAQLERAEAAQRDGRAVTAVDAYRAAVACFVFAQMAYNFDVPRKRDLYARLAAAAAAAAAAASAGALGVPRWERLELPFDGGRLFGWLVRPMPPTLGTVRDWTW